MECLLINTHNDVPIIHRCFVREGRLYTAEGCNVDDMISYELVEDPTHPEMLSKMQTYLHDNDAVWCAGCFPLT